MSKKAREKPAEAGSASVSPYGSVLSYEQVTSQPNRLINLIWPECRTWFIGPCLRSYCQNLLPNKNIKIVIVAKITWFWLVYLCIGFFRFKGTNPALKKPSNIPEIYAKMFGRSHWSRLYVFTKKKKLRNVEDIDVWNFRQERFMLRHLRQWSKNFGFGSALSHNSGAANTILFTIQTFNEHSRMAKLSQPYLRGHMRWNVTSLQIQLGLIGTYNFGRLSTLKSNILSTRKLRVLWPILWHISLTST